MTIAHLPDHDTIAVEPPDRLSTQWLEQAGLVRDDDTGLYRFRRDTDSATSSRQLSNARRLLAVAGYGVTRVYSEAEQRESRQMHRPWATPGPPRTSGGQTAWVHLVSDDVANGHLVVHADHQGSEGEIELLVSYPATGEAATFYSEGGGVYGASRHPDLASARAEWESFGYASAPPVPGSPRRAAARSVSARITQAPAAAELAAAVLPAGARSAVHPRAPF
ncbi:hypothetical protein ABZW30_08280 [Kitasatospora sp. NPDC004669]|uniref:hypothetical protein n=1 Tax=Kitasatospora sp. NPDC004669 TaxID=3154555 RepID=UPI0033B4B47B